MTDNGNFEQTPLFQLNLFLWLVWSTASGSITGIRPVFQEEGFELQAIGQPLSLSIQANAKATQAKIDLQGNAHPDLLLKHHDRRLFLPIECKKKSFSPDSSTSRQAYTLLCHTGSAIAQQIPLSSPNDWSSHLHYAVASGYQLPMLTTLNELSRLLQLAEIDTAFSDAIGIEIIPNTGVMLNFTNPQNEIRGPYQPQSAQLLIKELAPGEFPDVLYLLPVTLGAKEFDPIEIRVLQERLRSGFASLILQNFLAESFTITLDQLMQEGIDATLDNQQIQFNSLTPFTAGKLRDYLVSKKFREGGIHLQEALGQMRLEDAPNYSEIKVTKPGNNALPD